MFSPREFLSFVKESGIKPKKWKKIMRAYLKSKDFYGWLFNPSKDQIIDYNDIIDSMYGGLTEDPDKLRMIIDIVGEDVTEFGRSTAVYMHSIADYAKDVANKAFSDVNAKFGDGIYTRSEAEKKNEKISKYADVVTELADMAIDVIKHDAKVTSKKSGIPKPLCKLAFNLVPDPIFISNSKVVVYLNMLLTHIYSDIDRRETDVDDIDWDEFFDELFGKSNRYEVASGILLESPNIIEKFGSKNVRVVWDSLTAWSLKCLDKCDDTTRGHMIELYLKRLGNAVDSGVPSIRVDLRSISEKEYPRLTKTVSSHIDQFESLFKPLKTGDGKVRKK